MENALKSFQRHRWRHGGRKKNLCPQGALIVPDSAGALQLAAGPGVSHTCRYTPPASLRSDLTGRLFAVWNRRWHGVYFQSV